MIDSSLTVSTLDPTPLSFKEGEGLAVKCQASTITIQHTHLSVTWMLHKDGEDNAQPIISLDKDFTLVPGSGFERRYQAGDIRLDKLDDMTYRLNIAHLQLSDQGKIFCQAKEWIQDPDQSWYAIAESDAEKITLQVKARGENFFCSGLVVFFTGCVLLSHRFTFCAPSRGGGRQVVTGGDAHG